MKTLEQLHARKRFGWQAIRDEGDQMRETIVLLENELIEDKLGPTLNFVLQ